MPDPVCVRKGLPGAFISVNLLESMVIQELDRLSAEYLDMEELEQNLEYRDSAKTQKQKLLMDLAAYQRKAEEYGKGLRDLYLDKVKGIISESDFLTMEKDFSAEKVRLEQLTAAAQQHLPELNAQIAAGDNSRELVEQYIHSAHLTREMVEILIDHSVAGKRTPGEKAPPVEIHWNF